jgi:homoaconitate hydratase
LTSKKATPQTLTEKIVQRYAVGLPEGKLVQSGDYISLAPEYCMTHDNSWPIILRYMSIGATQIHRPQQLVMALDHDVQNISESNLKKYRQIEAFAKQHGIHFYPAGRGIGHQIMVEEGYAWPNTLAVASDSHANMYGGVACLSTALVRSDASSIFATGRTWWKIPPIAKMTLTGSLPPGATGKDVIVALCGLLNQDQVLNHAIEFTGSDEAMQSLTIDDRLTIANMTTEWGSNTALFPMDAVLRRWLEEKIARAAQNPELPSTTGRLSKQRLEASFSNILRADPGARYAKRFYLNLSTVAPYVSGPNSVKVATPLHELPTISIDKAYLVSCTNSRASDLAAAAQVFRRAADKGQTPRVAEGVQLYMAAASQVEQWEAETRGDWQTLLAAGAQPLPAGCATCIGLGVGLLEEGEVGISASNRNFKGRMGSVDAHAYLASPAVVAASALHGRITSHCENPYSWMGVECGEGDGTAEQDHRAPMETTLDGFASQLDGLIETAEHETEANPSTSVYVHPDFPERITGEILFCDADAINTDGIYPGRLTYQDNTTIKQMAEACMQNYDPTFTSTAKAGDILVSGFGFGCGSSREQAATAIAACAIPLVVAGSFSSIFARNSINNALPTLELPELVKRLRARFPESLPTRRTGWSLTWDVRRNIVEINEGPDQPKWNMKVGELSPNIQEIIAAGGIGPWVKSQINSTS